MTKDNKHQIENIASAILLLVVVFSAVFLAVLLFASPSL